MTIKEVEARKVQLETELSTALEAAKVLTPATAEFDEAYARYLSAKANLAKIPEEINKARLAENAEEIKTAATTVAEAIKQLVDGLGVEKLLGIPVAGIRYLMLEAGPSVAFNPVTRKAEGKAKGEAKGDGAKGKGRTVVLTPEGDRLSLTKFVLAHATEAEKATSDFKYPHTRVDSKPKFEAFCTEHSLTGYVYELAEASETPAPEAPAGEKES